MIYRLLLIDEVKNNLILTVKDDLNRTFLHYIEVVYDILVSSSRLNEIVVSTAVSVGYDNGGGGSI